MKAEKEYAELVLVQRKITSYLSSPHTAITKSEILSALDTAIVNLGEALEASQAGKFTVVPLGTTEIVFKVDPSKI